MKNPWIIIGVVTLILIAGSFWFSSSVAKKSDEGVDATKSYIKGNPEAAVTLVEYSDFQCPACASFHPVLVDLMNEFGDDIRFEYKHFPLPMHPLALPAARAVEAAGQQDAFYEFHDLIFENQKTWSNSPNPNALFVQYAESLGLDIEQFKRQMNSSLLKDRIDSDLQSGRDLGITGTPTFFLNGEKMTITTYDDFYQQIEAAINPKVQFDLPISDLPVNQN